MNVPHDMDAADVFDALRAYTLRSPPPAMQRLRAAFDLGEFEQKLVMLAFALEICPEVAPFIARIDGGREVTGLPVTLAHAVLQVENWNASSPLGPLRRWQILNLVAPAPRSLQRLRLAENVTDAMLGLAGIDAALTGIGTPLGGDHAVSDEQVRELADALAKRGANGLSPVVVGRWIGGQATAAALIERLGLRPYRLDASRLAAAREHLPTLQRLWEREVALHAIVPIAEHTADPDASAALAEFCSGLASHVVILGEAAPDGLRRGVHRIVHRRVTATDKVAMWRQALGAAASDRLNGSVERAAAHFDLAPDAISAAAATARPAIESAMDTVTAEQSLWAACRHAAWPQPGPLARVVEPQAGWDHLVVPQVVRDDLESIVRHVRHAGIVFEQWGFAAGSDRGRGLLALFAGPSGTGKTLAAEVIAHELRLPLVKADFSQLQSKWVGETPKLVGRLFDELEAGGAVLLIDEADGLVGRRGAVVEAQDRHANVEVAYFLQRLEAFRGLAILTTNMKSAIDEAFLRRFRFLVDFPMPGPAERASIWRCVFPADAPQRDVDADTLARLPLSGGAIRNVALNAAFLAAEAPEPIAQSHIVSALRTEYRKLERSTTEIDIGVLA
jgi:hypothetical protein